MERKARDKRTRQDGRRIEDPHNPPEPQSPPSEVEMHKLMEAIGRYMEILPPDRMPKEA